MAARRVSASAVVRYFSGDDDYLAEVFCDGSDDDLGIEDLSDEESGDEEPASNEQLSGDGVQHKYHLCKQSVIQCNATEEVQFPGPMEVEANDDSDSSVEGKRT